MSQSWFYCKHGERLGPLPLEELKVLVASKELQPQDLVWCSDFGSQWKTVAQADALHDSRPVKLPPALVQKKRAVHFDSTSAQESFRPSVAAAFGSAWQRMVDLLFKPFDIASWFGIGFCVWLAALGTKKGGDFTGIPNWISAVNQSSRSSGDLDFPALFKTAIDQALSNIAEQLKSSGMPLASITGALAVFLVIFIAFSWVLMYFKSRGNFMVIQKWYHPDKGVGRCWSEAREGAGRVFRWRAGFFVVTLLANLGIFWYAYSTLILPYYQSSFAWSPDLQQVLIRVVVLTAASLLISLLVEHFLVAFVVPVVFWHKVSVFAAWRKVIELCNQFPGALLLYLLGQTGLLLTAFVATNLIVFMTCCIAGIPYIYCVATLPVSLLFRGYSICFISQWRDDFIPGAEID